MARLQPARRNFAPRSHIMAAPKSADRELLDAAVAGNVEGVKAALAKGADYRYTLSGPVRRGA